MSSLLQNILPKACTIVNQLEKGFDSGFRKLVYNDVSKKPTNYVCGKDTTDKLKKVIFINGIFTSLEQAKKQANYISHMRCCRVYGTHVPSKGLVYDALRVVQALREMGVQNDCAQKVVQNIRERLFEVGYQPGKHAQNKAIQGKVVIFAYSGGGAVLDGAAKLLTREERDMLRVITLGSSVLFSRDRFYKVLNVINTADIVPIVSEAISKKGVSLEVPIKYSTTGHDPYSAHDVFNGYADAF